MNIDDIKLYRMTHIFNIPHILQYGIVHRNSANASSNYVAIGDVTLINTRNSKHIIINNGNISNMVGKVILGDFIPFYFGVRMPMLYVVQHGGNFVAQATLPENIIYLTCLLSDIIQSGYLYYFSDGHATDSLTSFYDNTQIANLPNIIDWVAIESQYWGGEDNLDLKRKKQAEFLIGNDISPTCLFGFFCYNAAAKERLLEMGVQDYQIKIAPNAYY
jgi:hypothetical protein